jgi:arsenate reductase
MTVRILHNPRCSKSRATLALLQQHGISPEITLYLEKPPGERELADICRMLGLAPRQLLRSNEAEYAELGLADPGLSNQQLLQAMHEHPRLIERPIVISQGKAAIGRPPENVLSIL